MEPTTETTEKKGRKKTATRTAPKKRAKKGETAPEATGETRTIHEMRASHQAHGQKCPPGWNCIICKPTADELLAEAAAADAAKKSRR